jgi:hypothetical protein
MNFIIPSFIYLYEASQPPLYKFEEILNYLKDLIPQIKLKQKKEFFSFLLEKKNTSLIEEIAKKLSLSRVHNPKEKKDNTVLLTGEIEYEKRNLLRSQKIFGIVYDGFKLQMLYKEYLKREEQRLSYCHIILTNQLLATFDENDKIYHLRVGIYGIPNIISTVGLLEALAKPKDFYFKMQMGIPYFFLREEFKDKILDYEDARITEILKGYCLQALFYHITGELFCEDKRCRLYNAHWQEEVLEAQLNNEYELCPKHSKILSRWQRKLPC